MKIIPLQNLELTSSKYIFHHIALSDEAEGDSWADIINATRSKDKIKNDDNLRSALAPE